MALDASVDSSCPYRVLFYLTKEESERIILQIDCYLFETHYLKHGCWLDGIFAICITIQQLV